MAYESTITLYDTLVYTRKYLQQRPIAIGNEMQPALTAANLVKSTIQGPPFRWRWNRQVVAITCSPTTQDYTTAMANFGFIESAAVQDPVTLIWKPLEVKIGIEKESTPGRPQFLSAQADDDNGNIIFRFSPVPDKAYTVSLTYQQQDPRLTSLNTAWGVPDEYEHLYTWGFKALMALFAENINLYQLSNAKFISTLLAAQQGLDQSQVNIFLNNWQAVTGTPAVNQSQLMQGMNTRAI